MEKVDYYLGKSNVSRHISIPWMAANNKAHSTQIYCHFLRLTLNSVLLHYIMLNVEHEKIF